MSAGHLESWRDCFSAKSLSDEEAPSMPTQKALKQAELDEMMDDPDADDDGENSAGEIEPSALWAKIAREKDLGALTDTVVCPFIHTSSTYLIVSGCSNMGIL